MMIKALNSVKNGEDNFMILQINIPEEEETRQYVHWIFDVDYSGSMSARSIKDERTRLEHVQSTLVNILEYLKLHSVKPNYAYFVNRLTNTSDICRAPACSAKKKYSY